MTISRTPAAKFNDIPGSLPTSEVPENPDVSNIATTALRWMNDLQPDHLADNIIWRDILSFTDTFRTFYSIETVHRTLHKLGDANNRSPFRLTADSEPRITKTANSSWVDVDLDFSVHHGQLTGLCSGIVSLTYEPSGQWKIWMLRTWLECYEGHGHPDEPVLGEKQADDRTTEETNGHIYDVIIVGGGQGGLGAAGRSQALGIDYILFDERPSIGDSWGHRYDSLKWHTIREYGNLPFGRTFEGEENLLPKDRIAARYRDWSRKHEINAQEATHVDNASWDASGELWTVSTSGGHGGQKWKCRNLVLCIGPGHKNPVSPEWATEERIKASGFEGTIMHAVNYHNAKEWAGKRGIVVGTANTGHDVAEDMANLGMSTTILQRGPTFIFPGEWLVAAHSHEYHEGKSTALSDRQQVTPPSKILREMVNTMVWGMIRKFPKLFDDLERVGFKVERYGDLFSTLYIRWGGHYVDIGSCARIINGEIKVKNTPVRGLTQHGILFEDGSELNADLIVLATGFNHDFRKDAAEIVGHDVAEQMDNFWGIDKEGELRGYSRLAGHPHLFYHGAEARMARFYSRFLALQLQKMKLGESLQPYTED